LSHPKIKSKINKIAKANNIFFIFDLLWDYSPEIDILKTISANYSPTTASIKALNVIMLIYNEIRIIFPDLNDSILIKYRKNDAEKL